MRHAWTGGLLFAAAAVLAQGGPAVLPAVGGGSYAVPVKTLKDWRRGSTVLQEFDFSCGSAALATLLSHHYGTPVAERQVLERMYADGDQARIRREGFSLLDMKRFLARLGFEADGFQQPLEKLAEARLPAIVLVNDGGYQHFVVIQGLRGDRVLVGDPARGTRTLPRAEFDRLWVGGLLFVIHNRTQQARFNLASDWRAAPAAPLGAASAHGAPGAPDLPKHGPGDF